MFDLKTRKRDFEHQLFFLLEKSQTSGRKSKFQAIERRKVARPRDRRAQSVIRVFFCLPRSFRRRLRNDLRYEIFVFSSSSLDAEKPKNNHLLLFLSQNAFDTKTKRREKKCASSEVRVHFCLPRSFRRRRRNDLRKLKEGFFSIIARLRERAKRAFFSRRPQTSRPNEKRDTRREKKRLAHLKTPRPFKDVTARHNQKGRKTFLLLPLFTQKPETGVSRTSVRGLPKRVTLRRMTMMPSSSVSLSEREKTCEIVFVTKKKRGVFSSSFFI